MRTTSTFHKLIPSVLLVSKDKYIYIYIFYLQIYLRILIERLKVKVKVKVKLFLCFNWAPRHEGVLGEWRCSSTHSLTSALDRVSGQLHTPAALPPWKEP
jgi:hypothetical protein